MTCTILYPFPWEVWMMTSPPHPRPFTSHSSSTNEATALTAPSQLPSPTSSLDPGHRLRMPLTPRGGLIQLTPPDQFLSMEGSHLDHPPQKKDACQIMARPCSASTLASGGCLDITVRLMKMKARGVELVAIYLSCVCMCLNICYMRV